MTQIRKQLFTLEHNDRVQIKCESNFSIDVLKELIQLRPTEICVTKTFTSSMILEISHVPGISISHIKSEFEKAPYVADIDSQHYQRLVLGIDTDTHSWVVNCTDVNRETLESLSTGPIVIKALLEPGRGQALLFAASKNYRFLKATDSRTDNIAFEPDSIPDGLLRLVDIVDEPLPNKRVSLEILDERAKTTAKLLSNYADKKLTIKAREDVLYALAEINDYQAKIQIAIAECKDGDTYTVLFDQKLLAKLKQIMGGKKFEQQIGLFHREVKRELSKVGGADSQNHPIEINQIILGSVSDEHFKSDINALLNRKLSANMHIHQCGTCNSNANCTLVPGKRKFQVGCEKCTNKSGLEDISSRRIFSIIKWNEKNPVLDGDFWPCYLGYGGLSNDEFKAKILKINAFLMNSINQCRKSFGPAISESTQFKEIQDLVEILKFVSRLVAKSQ